MQFFISGMLFGLVAGIIPGPLLTLVITETIKHNKKMGIFVAAVPVVTDIPIVFLSVYVLAKLSSFHFILGTISILGALFIGYLAYESITVKGIEIVPQKDEAHSFRKGFITNILNPHPYLFWITIGAPNVLKAYTLNFLSAVFFVSGFYLSLVGSKIIVALIVDKSKTFLKSKVYVYIIKFLGLALLTFAVLFVKEGLKYFGII